MSYIDKSRKFTKSVVKLWWKIWLQKATKNKLFDFTLHSSIPVRSGCTHNPPIRQHTCWWKRSTSHEDIQQHAKLYVYCMETRIESSGVLFGRFSNILTEFFQISNLPCFDPAFTDSIIKPIILCLHYVIWVNLARILELQRAKLELHIHISKFI